MAINIKTLELKEVKDEHKGVQEYIFFLRGSGRTMVYTDGNRWSALEDGVKSGWPDGEPTGVPSAHLQGFYDNALQAAIILPDEFEGSTIEVEPFYYPT